MLVSPLLSLIDWTNIVRLVLPSYNYAVIIVSWLSLNTSFKGLRMWVVFLKTFHLEVLVFEFLVFILASLIVDLFVFVNWASIHWSRNLSSAVISNCLWVVSKSDICIFFPHRLVEGCDEVAGWVQLIFGINWLLCLI